ncbi:MAG TPA: hypothetical protein VH583_17070 [Vicinamibacterales bacterium]|jgi:hypothetical protein
MSQFRVEKRRLEAELTLSNGDRLAGCFFLATSNATHTGPERVAELLNDEHGFFPFESAGSADTVLVNRNHLVVARLLGGTEEVRLDPGYDVATVRPAFLKLSNRMELRGLVRIYLPEGRDRLSDYARAPELFRYVETPEAIFVVNTAHIVELSDLPGVRS